MLELHLNSSDREQGYTHAFQVTFADLTQTTANTAQVILLKTIPVAGVIQDVAVRVTTPFQNSADSGFNTTAITVGDSGTANLFLTSMETNVNGTIVRNKTLAATARKAYDAADSLNITFNAMSAKALHSLDTGALTVFAKIAGLISLAGS